MVLIVEDVLEGGPDFGFGGDGLTSVGVGVEAGEVRRGHLEADAMAWGEDGSGARQVDLVTNRLTGRYGSGFAQRLAEAGAHDAITEGDGAAVREDIDELGGEVRIRGIGNSPEDGLDGAGHGEGSVEGFAGIAEHIVTGLNALLVAGSGEADIRLEGGAALAGDGPEGVVEEAVGDS